MSESQHREELIAEVLIGEEAERFLDSELGQCLVGMAQQERQIAMEALENVNPTDVQEIERLQRQAWNGRHFELWIRELIDKGRQAYNVMKGEDESQN